MSKLFFSYSHKDTEAAQKIMDRLKEYRFKVWIDFGVVFPPDQLEKVLRAGVEKCEIFILLASKNSRSSAWVQYEVELSKQMPQSRRFQSFTFRDTVILSLDEWGSQVYETIDQLNRERLEEFNAALASTEQTRMTPFDKTLEDVLKRGAKKIINPEPGFIRIVAPTVKLFDLSKDFESGMQRVAKYLSNNTQMFNLKSDSMSYIRTIGFIFWGGMALVYGTVLLLVLVAFIVRALR